MHIILLWAHLKTAFILKISMKRKRFLPIYCAPKGTSLKTVFRSSLIIRFLLVTLFSKNIVIRIQIFWLYHLHP